MRWIYSFKAALLDQTRTLKPEHASVRLSGRETLEFGLRKAARGVMNNEWFRKCAWMLVGGVWRKCTIPTGASPLCCVEILSAVMSLTARQSQTWEQRGTPPLPHFRLDSLPFDTVMPAETQAHTHTHTLTSTVQSVQISQWRLFFFLSGAARWVPKDIFVWPIWVKAESLHSVW